MKIEKISDTQIKFILSKTDLEDRNIKLEELTNPNDKTQDLFRDIMEQALEECNFSSENAPLMVEAMPVASDGIMIIVTKLTDKDSVENKLTLLSQNKEVRRFKRKTISAEEQPARGEEILAIYSFETLDDVIDVSIRLNECYHGASTVYKYSGKYYLLLQNDECRNKNDFAHLEYILSEYGQKHVSTPLSKYYLLEHGELIIQSPAIKIMAKNFM